MSDLHRDVTRTPSQREGDARSLPAPIIEYRRVEDIVIQCTALTNELEKTDQLMKDRKDLFHKMWEEEQQRIMTEQSILKEQVRNSRTYLYTYINTTSYICRISKLKFRNMDRLHHSIYNEVKT